MRTTEKNIGVSPTIVTTKLGVIAIESEKRHSETGELVIAKAAELHHRAVWIHPFEDGHGRWARLLANIWLMQRGQPVTIWPATDLRGMESPTRDEYIAAIKRISENTDHSWTYIDNLVSQDTSFDTWDRHFSARKSRASLYSERDWLARPVD